MKHKWTVTRRGAPHPEAERRWDRAYQLLLACPAPVPPAPLPPEDRHDARTDAFAHAGRSEPADLLA